LQPAPTGHFTAALRAAIVERALSRRRIEVRVLIGQFPPKGVDAAAFLKELTDPARDIPGSGVTVSVLAMRTCTVLESCNSFSWNHGKFIVVDGREVIVGGHNLWTEDYLTENPVDAGQGTCGGQRVALCRPAVELCLQQSHLQGLDLARDLCPGSE